MKPHTERKNVLLRDLHVRAEYDALEDEFTLIAQRLREKEVETPRSIPSAARPM